MRVDSILLFLSCVILGVTSECPTLSNTPGMMTVNVSWTYDFWTQAGCKARVARVASGSSGGDSSEEEDEGEEWTTFAPGESKSLPAVGNDCIKFTCANYRLNWDAEASSCAYGSGCSSSVQTDEGCGHEYRCSSAVYQAIPQNTYSSSYQYLQGWFALFSGYTCGNTGSGVCRPDQCFNPSADPQGKDETRGPRCVGEGDSVVSAQNVAHVCQSSDTCDGHSYLDLVSSGAVCDVNGTSVPEGAVTWSDACSQTVCGGGSQLMTAFKGAEGCVYEDQCVGEGETVQGVAGVACADLTCRRSEDASGRSHFDFQAKQTGCFHEGKCYRAGKKVSVDGKCDKLVCQVSGDNYQWDHKYYGCYEPGADTCGRKSAALSAGKCVKSKCSTREYARWKTAYKTSGSCVPSDEGCGTARRPGCQHKGQCYPLKSVITMYPFNPTFFVAGSCVPSDEGCGTARRPGCQHKGQCYPLKSVITMDDCTQYVCYSDDEDLNEDHSDDDEEGEGEGEDEGEGEEADEESRPVWKARATGCYGPSGCMKLGEQSVDPHTLNTYRCTYDLAGWGIKYAQFHQACVAPNGEKLALGQSVFLDPVWYSCYRNGKMKNPIDTSIEFVPSEGYNHTCGLNPNTGKPLYKTEYYYTPVGRCRKRGYWCEESCDYYDQPCMDTDLTPWRYLGDAFKTQGSQCVCTQDYSVNNKAIPPSDSLFQSPSLCSQKRVTGGACTDPEDGSVHQWGEIWELSGSNPLQICTCHPIDRRATCSVYPSDINAVFSDMKID